MADKGNLQLADLDLGQVAVDLDLSPYTKPAQAADGNDARDEDEESAVEKTDDVKGDQETSSAGLEHHGKDTGQGGKDRIGDAEFCIEPDQLVGNQTHKSLRWDESVDDDVECCDTTSSADVPRYSDRQHIQDDQGRAATSDACCNEMPEMAAKENLAPAVGGCGGFDNEDVVVGVGRVEVVDEVDGTLGAMTRKLKSNMCEKVDDAGEDGDDEEEEEGDDGKQSHSDILSMD